MKKIIAAIMVILSVTSAQALVPLESLLLGDFSEHYSQYLEEIDPISYIFKEKGRGKEEFREKLALYRGFILEGENLKNRCERTSEVKYPTYWLETQAKRSTIATLQYVGLDVTIRALSEYGKYFEFSDGEYSDMVNNLVGNYCSNNLSIISHSQLKKNMMGHFRGKSGGFKLPSIDGNPLFPQSLKTINMIDKAREQEFAVTSKLFRAFCSWGGNTDNLRLLVPLLKSPAVMAFVIRTMDSTELGWQKVDNTIFKKKSRRGVAVLCENLICRRKESEEIYRKFPRSMGFKSFPDDLERAYCSYFKDASYKLKKQVPRIKKIIDGQSPEDDIFLISQFASLVNGVPDFFISLNKWSDGKILLRSSMDRSWDEWADERNRQFSRDLMFEEQLTIEKAERRLYFNMYRPKFSVEFDVNLGEYDRINQIIGKVDASFNIKLSKNYLALMRSRWGTLDPKKRTLRNKIISNFKLQITKDVERVRKMFTNPLWKGDMERIIVIEILDQLAKYEGDYFKHASTEKISIPITFNFAPFALKYLTYKFDLKEAQRRAKSFKDSLTTK